MEVFPNIWEGLACYQISFRGYVTCFKDFIHFIAKRRSITGDKQHFGSFYPTTFIPLDLEKITYMDTPASSIPEAIELAKQDDNDLVLLGYVNSFLDGGLTSNSVVDLSIKIIDVRTRTTIWYLHGQMKGKPGKSIDFLFFKPEKGKAVSPHLLSRRLLHAMIDTLLSG